MIFDLSQRRYIGMILTAVFVIGAVFAMVNYAANDFGLWRYRDSARIWTLEKTSKYLLAHRYVPENFDGIMIGPSVSANINPAKIEGFKIYNLSMAGGNVTETGAAARQYLLAPGDHKVMLICLYPYLTKNTGLKSFQIDAKEVYGSLFSLIPLSVWTAKGLYWLGAGGHNFDDSVNGWNNFTPGQKNTTAEKARQRQQMLRQIRDGATVPPLFGIDRQAVAELADLVDLARQRHVRVVAWYFPIFGPSFDVMQASGEWTAFQAAMADLFAPGEIVLDMNSPAFAGVRNDVSLYQDEAHMNPAGIAKVIAALNGALAK